MLNDINDDDEKIVTQLSLQTGVSALSIKKVFSALSGYVILQYAEDEKRIHIPMLGNIMIKYLGDKTTATGKEADIDVLFSPHENLKHLVGQVQDIKDGKGDPTKLDAYINLTNLIKHEFKTELFK